MNEERGHDPINRRPLASRSLGIFRSLAAWLARRNVSPDAISISSVFFAGLGALALCFTGREEVDPMLFWIAAAVCVQLRLLANLLDGLVAVEQSRASSVGELYNEIPDRVADALTLVPLGFVPGSNPHLGWLAALLAVFVAYVRSIGVVAGGGQAFEGIMSKPRRMFFVTVLCLFMAFAPHAWKGEWLPHGLGPPGTFLLLICLGCVLTSLTRLMVLSTRLRSVH